MLIELCTIPINHNTATEALRQYLLQMKFENQTILKVGLLGGGLLIGSLVVYPWLVSPFFCCRSSESKSL